MNGTSNDEEVVELISGIGGTDANLYGKGTRSSSA
jgi:hypothetical protein